MTVEVDNPGFGKGVSRNWNSAAVYSFLFRSFMIQAAHRGRVSVEEHQA